MGFLDFVNFSVGIAGKSIGSLYPKKTRIILTAMCVDEWTSTIVIFWHSFVSRDIGFFDLALPLFRLPARCGHDLSAHLPFRYGHIPPYDLQECQNGGQTTEN
jgi:hypothetical protein